MSGGASGSGFDLAGLTEKDAGDTYTVTSAGYFKVGAGAEFQANVGDNIVFDTSGDVFKIDNTNSTVAGTADFIAVSGSADTGYTVDVATAFKDRVSNAESAIGTVGNLNTTATDLTAAVNEHETDIGDVSTLTTTATNLAAAINELNAASIASAYVRETPAGTLNGSNTVFTLANTPIAATVQVFLNGVLQEPAGEDYTLSGTSVTFIDPPAATDRLRAIYFQ